MSYLFYMFIKQMEIREIMKYHIKPAKARIKNTKKTTKKQHYEIKNQNNRHKKKHYAKNTKQ